MFRIWNDEGTFDEEMTTDENGIISLAYAKHGSYHIQEVAVSPEGYVIADLDDEGNPTVTDFGVNDQGMIEWGESGAMAQAHEFELDNMPKTMKTTATDSESGTHEGQAREEARHRGHHRLYGPRSRRRVHRERNPHGQGLGRACARR